MVESCVEFPSLAIKVGQYFESTLEEIEAQKNIIDKFQLHIEGTKPCGPTVHT